MTIPAAELLMPCHRPLPAAKICMSGLHGLGPNSAQTVHPAFNPFFSACHQEENNKLPLVS